METPTLEGPHVHLEPLTLEHIPALQAIAFDPSIWRYMVYPMTTPEHLHDWVKSALNAQTAGTALPWITIHKGSEGNPDQIAGGTRFMDLDLKHRSTELGSTWLVQAFRGTRVNLEAKLLQLTYAFETLGLLRVAFKTHDHNQRSKAAIRSIGAIYEGTFRNHYVMPDGSSRDSAWFSIIKQDWPEVKEMLTRRLNAPL
jgi:N-acetyltransferase